MLKTIETNVARRLLDAIYDNAVALIMPEGPNLSPEDFFYEYVLPEMESLCPDVLEKVHQGLKPRQKDKLNLLNVEESQLFLAQRLWKDERFEELFQTSMHRLIEAIDAEDEAEL